MAQLRVPVDDAMLDVRTWGEGEPLLLVQTALSAEELVPLGRHPALAGAYRVLDLRRRGYAAREGKRADAASRGAGSAPGSVVLDAEDCASILEQLDAAPAHVVGTSYSAAVALELATRRPDLVRSLTLVEPPPTDVAAGEEFRSANRQLLEAFRRDGVTIALERFTRVLGTASWVDERARADPALVEQVEQDAAVFFQRDVPALLAWRYPAERDSRVRAPVLYVGGAESGPWFLQAHDWVRGLFPDAEHHVLAGAGHTVVSTHTDEVARLVADFAGRHRR